MQTDYSVELQICIGELSCLFAIILVPYKILKLFFLIIIGLFTYFVI